MLPTDFSHKSSEDLHTPLKVTWGNVTEKNVKQLRILNTVIFPINYSDQFYKDAVNAPSGFVKLAYYNEVAVAAVCCRKEIYVSNHTEFYNKQQSNNNNDTSTADPPTEQQQLTSNKVNTQENGSTTSNSNSAKSNPTSPNSNNINLSEESKKFSLYILTLGVLAPYRERGIGQQLIQHVLKLVESSPSCKDVVDIYVHVQEGNDDALQFYDRYGFKVTEKISNYYRRIEPADCFIVRKSVNVT